MVRTIVKRAQPARINLRAVLELLVREPTSGERQGVLDVDQCTLDDVVELIVRGRADREEKVDYLSFG